MSAPSSSRPSPYVSDPEKVTAPALPYRDETAENSSEEDKPMRAPLKLRIYCIIQYIMNAALAIVIVLIMLFTLAKYNSTKDVDGAWPPNAIVSPTLLMLIVSVLNVLIDVVDLMFQCCGSRARNVVARLVASSRKYTAILAAVAAGFSAFAKNATNGNDLWGWSCSDAADAMQAVNKSGTICMTNTTAWDLQILQIIFQLLSVAVPFFARWRFGKELNHASSGRATGGGNDGKKLKGDEAAKMAIKDSKGVFDNLAQFSDM